MATVPTSQMPRVPPSEVLDLASCRLCLTGLSALPVMEIEKYFRPYGRVRIVPFHNSEGASCAYIYFENPSLAYDALHTAVDNFIVIGSRKIPIRAAPVTRETTTASIETTLCEQFNFVRNYRPCCYHQQGNCKKAHQCDFLHVSMTICQK